MIDRGNGVGDEPCNICIAGREIIERSMRLDVTHFGTSFAADVPQCRYLSNDLIKKLCVRNIVRDPAEILLIGISGVSADCNAVLHGKRNRRPHRLDITGVSAAGDIRGSDQRHQLCVVSAALAQIAV